MVEHLLKYIIYDIAAALEDKPFDAHLLASCVSYAVFKDILEIPKETLIKVQGYSEEHRDTSAFTVGEYVAERLSINLSYAAAFSLIFLWERKASDDTGYDFSFLISLFRSSSVRHAIDRLKIFIYELDIEIDQKTQSTEKFAPVVSSFLNEVVLSEIVNYVKDETDGIRYYRTLDDHRQASLSIYKWFDSFCKENGFRYFLIGGNLIGAVRNGKMTPWDDDVDVVMMYPDYERFNDVIESVLPKPYYWSHPYNNKKHPRFFGKIIHEGKCCIDVFPVVKTSSCTSCSKLQFLFNKVLYRLYVEKIGFLGEVNPKRLHARMLKYYIPFISRDMILKLSYWNMARFRKKKRYRYVSICGKYGYNKELIERRWIEGSPESVDFEGILSPSYCKNQEFLNKVYGDYLCLPKICDRVALHELIIKC